MSPTSFEQSSPSTSELASQTTTVVTKLMPTTTPAASKADEAQQVKAHKPSSVTVTAMETSAAAPQLYWAPTNYITPALSSFGNTAPVMSTYGCTPLLTPKYFPCNCCCSATVAATATATAMPPVPVAVFRNESSNNSCTNAIDAASSTFASTAADTSASGSCSKQFCALVTPSADAIRSSTAVNNMQSNELKKETWSIGFYEISDVIGQGNYARVRKGFHRITKTPVAVKCIDKQKMDEASMIRAKREIAILKRLNHPNIATLYQVFETTRGFYLVMQYAANGELANLLPGNRIVPEAEARVKLWQIVSAVEYCHNLGIVHRDLKLENLLLDKNFNIKIVDFGFSNTYSTNDTLKTFCGSPPYAAPEIFEGREYVGPEVDIWSMGVILYKLVCGDLPFNAPAYHDLRYRVTRCPFRVPFYLSTDCENLLRKMLHKNPKRRATIPEIKSHPWMMEQNALNTLHALRRPVPDFLNPNESILTFMEKSLNISRQKVENACKSNTRDDVQAWYTLLWELIYLKDLVKEDCQSTSTDCNKKEIANDDGQCSGTIANECAVTVKRSDGLTSEKTNISNGSLAMTTTATVTMPLAKAQASMATAAAAVTKIVAEPYKLQKFKRSQQNQYTDATALNCAIKKNARVPPEERVFLRQSTATTITSLDEGFETDAHASSATIYNSKELPTKVTLRAISLPYESVNDSVTISVPANEVQSTSQPENTKVDPEPIISGETQSNLLENFVKETASLANDLRITTSKDSETNIKTPTMLDIVTEEADSSRVSFGKVDDGRHQPESAKLNFLDYTEILSSTDKAVQMQQQLSHLPDSLQFQPHKLLNIKQSLHLEQQISDSGESSNLSQTRSSRMIKQLQRKNRLNRA